MRSAFPPALVPFHASETAENRTKNRKSNITLDIYVKSDECCLLRCITPEVTLI